MTNTITSAQSALQQLFSRTDADKSGSLNASEFKSIASTLSAAGMGGKGQSVESMFATLDADKNGELSTQELEDGAKLADQITSILLQIQEMQGGGMFSSLLGKSDSTSSMFSSGSEASISDLFGNSTSQSDPLTALLGGTSGSEDFGSSTDDLFSSLIQQLMASYQSTASATEETSTGSTVNQAA